MRYVVSYIPVMLLAMACNAQGQGIELATDYYRHGLQDRAVEAFIDVVHAPSSSATHIAEALYFLGEISFEQGRYSVALETWNNLIENYPESARSIEIRGRLAQLSEVISETSDASITSAVARSYLRNGDFWSEAGTIFTIDHSWLPAVEMANSWYDRIIAEFPGTDAAELAHRRRLLTLLGWRETGQYGSSYGLRDDFRTYMPQVLAALEDFATEFPESSAIPAFQYQIAQAYWREKDWVNTRLWLRRILDNASGQTTFYSELAQARLQRVEY